MTEIPAPTLAYVGRHLAPRIDEVSQALAAGMEYGFQLQWWIPTAHAAEAQIPPEGGMAFGLRIVVTDAVQAVELVWVRHADVR